MYIYNVYILYIFFHYGLSQESEYSSPCYTVLECVVTQLCLTLGYPRTVAHKAPLSVGLSRQEYWSGLLFPSLGNLTSIIPSAKSDSFISCHPIRVGIFGTALCASIDLVCLWKKVSSGSLYTAILWLEFHFLLKWSFLKSHHYKLQCH